MTDPTLLRRPGAATRWLEALPLGNGRIGAMAWGDPVRARFGLNESTFWSGSPTATRDRRTSREEASQILARAREQFEAGQVARAQQMLEGLGAAWSQAYQPVGDLIVTGGASVEGVGARADTGGADSADIGTSGAGGTAGDAAERVLDLARAEHRVRTPAGEQLSFVSTADDVLVHAFPLAGDSAIEVELDSPQVEEHRRTASGQLAVVLRAPSDAPPSHQGAPMAWNEEGPGRIAVVVRSRHEGDRALVVCALVTTWRGFGAQPDRPVADALAEARRQAEAALAHGEDELHRRHLAQPLPGAHEVALTLDGAEDSALLATCFAYGRYLLASSSRPGLPPATLQGIWNAQVSAPWNSNYTVNINLEMNHWAAGVAHVPAAAAALEKYTAMLREVGQETARRLYGADGWTVHHNSDPWGYSDPVDGDPKWATWPMGGLWLERELDSLAAFSGEDAATIAARRFPARRSAAAFALDLLHESADGHLVTFPSTSPENEWIASDGQTVALSEGAGMDRWLLREVLEAVVADAELLGRLEDPVVSRAVAALALVPEPRIGADGRVLEWHADALAEVEPTHRHVSHLGFLYPGTQEVSAELERAAAASLDGRGDEATGWSLVWKTALWARLHRPDKVQDLLELFLRPAERADGSERSGLYPNLFSAHPPFQIDGNLGIVAALAECLLQSHREEIELLPALPPIMADGSVRGLRARPGIAVDMSWTDGVVTAVRLRALGPGARGVHHVRCAQRTTVVELTDEQAVEVELAGPPASAQRPMTAAER
ncbi:glycosyl hydrolase family 95 catalytic domain-containing protein [Brachybacterium fresconis]|uniref:Alpha-L-fucosidase 2 n=1 Tax=Brachybacterium fresconis TaxID=173363 RepID=A0ABS4YK51_9MICO|nr:glycoside hydrolase N-terminal domain-containing protein [Brachybacterium fresconis]MBP2409177.1 alpha-L-fucosidase 2 [Brachybacterium fresconis]